MNLLDDTESSALPAPTKAALPFCEVVVAAYKEPLEWIDYLPENKSYRLKISVSDPDRSTCFPKADEVFRRPNYGREAGHWLQHIVERYDSLAQWTVFIQGEPFFHCGGNLHGPTGLFRILFGKFEDIDAEWVAVGADPTRKPFPFPTTHLGKRLEILKAGWGEEVIPTHGSVFLIGAQFIVKREAVLRRPKSHYEGILNLCTRTDFSLAHELEPIWSYVFDLGLTP
jgi:hypothetical protein